MRRWDVATDEWCLLDGPAIKLHQPSFDSSSWRDHLNIYIVEHALPWQAKEQELTVPPHGTVFFKDFLEASGESADIHLVPALRYYQAGFERRAAILPSGCSIKAATLRGCSQVWSYKSAEIIENSEHFEGDVERIIDERLVRLRAALAAAEQEDVRAQLLLLQQGYEALGGQEILQAQRLFEIAAGRTWKSLT